MKATRTEAVIYILQTQEILETIYTLAYLQSLLNGTSQFEVKGWLKRMKVGWKKGYKSSDRGRR